MQRNDIGQSEESKSSRVAKRRDVQRYDIGQLEGLISRVAKWREGEVKTFVNTAATKEKGYEWWLKHLSSKRAGNVQYPVCLLI